VQTDTTTVRRRRNASPDSIVVTQAQRKDRTMTRSTLGFTLTDVLVAIAIFSMVVIVIIPKL